MEKFNKYRKIAIPIITMLLCGLLILGNYEVVNVSWLKWWHILVTYIVTSVISIKASNGTLKVTFQIFDFEVGYSKE